MYTPSPCVTPYNLTHSPTPCGISFVLNTFCDLNQPTLITLDGTINPFAPELPVTARADPGPFYPLWRHQF